MKVVESKKIITFERYSQKLSGFEPTMCCVTQAQCRSNIYTTYETAQSN